jgi:hypothetical protein
LVPPSPGSIASPVVSFGFYLCNASWQEHLQISHFFF